jgi:hypothetical protein
MHTAYSMTNWIRQRCACWVPKNFSGSHIQDTPSCIWHTMPIRRAVSTVYGYRGWNMDQHVTPKTGNTHQFPQGKKLKAMLSDFGNFWGHKCMLLVDSLDCGNTNCWVLLWYSWEVTAGYALQKAWFDVPSFCMVTLGLILWTRLVTGCDTGWEVMDNPHYNAYCIPGDLHIFGFFNL